MDYIKGMTQRLEALAVARDARILASANCDVKITHQPAGGETPRDRVVSAAVRVPVRADLLYVISPLAESRRLSLQCVTCSRGTAYGCNRGDSQGNRRFWDPITKWPNKKCNPVSVDANKSLNSPNALRSILTQGVGRAGPEGGAGRVTLGQLTL